MRFIYQGISKINFQGRNAPATVTGSHRRRAATANDFVEAQGNG
jgi:hypothetical protein